MLDTKPQRHLKIPPNRRKSRSHADRAPMEEFGDQDASDLTEIIMDEMTVRIKQQPFDPPFVVQLDSNDVASRIHRLDDNSVVAKIDGVGTYRIDITDVGFWFVERKAKRYEPDEGVPQGIRGGILERMLTAVATSVGWHCGTVADEFREIRDFLSPRSQRL